MITKYRALVEVEALNNIANEIAESNRLKRIEIRSLFVIENGQIEAKSPEKIFYALDNTNSFMKELENPL